ncbi:hypothetical protein SAMN00777080_2194 [Aquiflexum balticum DSM 16537]|uniref:Uncharacterized protein n=1 Tax=Aquiflexum balticum DSM 16537 TaxID=758820 RepID=A0A1W2H3S9_9BACT|nr:hypothetical protein SAMN00777080_2194 [Aquiflexum balticum DSM 16537]
MIVLLIDPQWQTGLIVYRVVLFCHFERREKSIYQEDPRPLLPSLSADRQGGDKAKFIATL